MLRDRKLRSFFDQRVFVDAAAKWRLERRLERDVGERGRTRASIIRQFRGQVEPMHERYVQNQGRYADVGLTAPIAETAVAALLTRLLTGKEKAGR